MNFVLLMHAAHREGVRGDKPLLEIRKLRKDKENIYTNYGFFIKFIWKRRPSELFLTKINNYQNRIIYSKVMRDHTLNKTYELYKLFCWMSVKKCYFYKHA